MLSIAEDNTQKGQIKAQLILEKAGVAEFVEYTPLPEDEMEDKMLMFDNNSNANIESTEDLLYIYPNPVKDVLTVEYALLTNASINTLGVYDAKGTLLIKVPISEQIGIEKINVSSLAKGNYVISFGTKGVNKFSKKFVIN